MEWALLGFGAVAVLVGIGFAIGYAVSTPGRANLQVPSTTPTTCADFCAAWQSSRIDVCNADADAKSAKDVVDAMQKTIGYLSAAATVSLVAAVAAALIPFIGGAISATLFSAAATLLATVVVLVGVMAGAAFAWIQKMNEATAARNAETAARLAVFENCSQAEAATCMAMPAPC
jgi:hypothetical protein